MSRGQRTGSSKIRGAPERDAIQVHPFEPPDVIAGQGALGLELLDDEHDRQRDRCPYPGVVDAGVHRGAGRRRRDGQRRGGRPQLVRLAVYAAHAVEAGAR
ncbi:MAG: hypothetical protein ACRDYA_25220 [Egibacteraceae bacterium]